MPRIACAKAIAGLMQTPPNTINTMVIPNPHVVIANKCPQGFLEFNI